MQPQPALTDTEANMYILVASDAVVLFLISSLNDFQCSVPAGYEKYLLFFSFISSGFLFLKKLVVLSFHQFRMRVETLVFVEKNYTQRICEVK